MEKGLINTMTFLGNKVRVGTASKEEKEEFMKALFDFLLYATEFVMHNEVVVKEECENELNSLLKVAFENYAANAIFNKTWEPEEDDESPLVRNIKIRHSIMSLQKNTPKPVKVDSLEEFEALWS